MAQYVVSVALGLQMSGYEMLRFRKGTVIGDIYDVLGVLGFA